MEGNYRILIVEDDKEIREGIEIYLKNQGYEVYQAENGKEGLAVIEERAIHLAIVDIMMPVMDGVTMLMYLEAVNLQGNKDKIYTIGGLELNEDTVEVSVDGAPVKLTPMEFKIIQLLIKNPGRVYSADEIYERIWNEKAINTDTIMVHVRNIREKIEIDPKNPKYLKVVWGVGYKIEKQ